MSNRNLPRQRTVRWTLSALALALFAATGALQAHERESRAAAFESITAGELQYHVDQLAADALQGREAGSAGGRAAGDYLATLLERAGLHPAGDAGSYFQQFGNGYRNVLGWIEGRDAALQHQYILIGAHYDHVGYGTHRNSRGPVGYIHNGADDNASGTAGVLEVVQAFTMLPEPPRRSILFAFWDAEEKGLLGSQHWARQPTVPLDGLVLAMNADMIGRLRNNELDVWGVRTAAGLRQLLSRANMPTGLTCRFRNEVRPNGDHHTFFARDVPFVMFHTGLHDDYHTPRDDPDTVNAVGTRRVARLMFETAAAVAERNAPLAFRAESRNEARGSTTVLFRPQLPVPPRLGIQYAAEAEGPGVQVTAVTPGGAADLAGIRVGDRILELADYPVAADARFPMVVLAARSPARVVLRRAGAEEEPVELSIDLSGKPFRVGISWREDAAEPGTVVLTRVVSGSAAAMAGLAEGDRLYEIDGQRFDDGEQLRDRLLSGQLVIRLLVERAGLLRTVELELLPPAPAAPAAGPSTTEPATAAP